MRALLRHAFPLLVAAGAAGCTAIADPGSYVYDEGCDLDLELIGFDGPHLTQNVIVQLDTPPSASSRQTKGIAVVVGIPSGPFAFQIPGGIHYRDASIDFFVDNTAPFGTYNPENVGGNGRGDHSWTITPACGAHAFTHVAQFDDFEEFPALDEDLIFDMTGFALAGQHVELLVSQYDASLDAVDGDGDGRFALAFQHTTSATEGGGGHFVPERLRGMLDRGASFRVEVFVDRNGNHLVDDSSTVGDPTDEGYVFGFSSNPSDEPGTTRIPMIGPIPLDATMAGSDDHSGVAGLRYQ